MPRTKANNITPACSARMTFSLRLMGRLYRRFAVLAQVLALLLLAAPAWAQLTFDSASEKFDSTGTTVTMAHTTSGSDRALIVCLAMDSSTATSSSVTYAGAGMTLVNRRQANYGGPGRTLEMWSLSDPATGTNNVVVNKSQSNMSLTGAVSFTGAHQTTASLTGTVTGADDNPSINVSSASGEIVIDCELGDASGMTSPTEGAGQTKRVDISNGGGFPIWLAMSTEAGAATVTMSWTGDGSRNMHSGVSVKPPAGGGAPASASGRRRVQ